MKPQSTLAPDYVGSIPDITNFHRHDLYQGLLWEISGVVPEKDKPLISKGVVAYRTGGRYECIVPCRFSGIRLLTSILTDSSTERLRAKEIDPILLDQFFFVTTLENKNWDLYSVGSRGFEGVPLLGSRQEIAFIGNRHLCLLSAPSSKRVVTLPGRVAPHNIEVTSENPKEFIFRISASSSTLNGLYVSNLETGEIVKAP